jgi:outer membrane protein
MIRRFMHTAIALFMAASMAAMPLYAQAQNQDQNNAPPPGSAAAAPAAPAGVQPHMQAPPPQYQPPTETQGPPPSPTRTISLGPHKFAQPWYPNIIAPYQGVHVPEPMLTNTPKIEQLIQNGKLMLSLEDAISLGLENNLSIAVSRYTPMLDEANLLLAQSGANGRAPFDPTLTSSFSLEENTVPINNPFLAAGVTTTGPPAFTAPLPLISHALTANFGYTQYFQTGTEAQVTFDNSWSSQPANLSFNLLNPYTQSTLGIQITQPLLNGFGKIPNTRYIIEARNTVRVGESQFRQQVIAQVTTIATAYWELVFARENVKVEQVTVAADQQLYENNKKQEQIGTMAPLDVIDAQSQLATDQQALVQAQTVQLLDQTNLLVDITKDPLAAPLQGVEIVPTTPIYSPAPTEASLEQAVQTAMQNRPEIEQADLNLKNAGVEIKATKNGLRPTLDVFGLYQATALSGTEQKCVANCSFFGATGPKVTIPFPVGLGYGLNSMIAGDFPTFEGGLNLTLPIRNRAAQAAYATAEINQRQQEASYMQTRSTIIANVRQALIVLEQDRAAVAAAQEARIYNQQSYDDEVKKLQLGTSTAFTVVQKQQLLTVAEGTELRDRINLIQAELAYQQAIGTTLQDHNISIAGVSARVSPTPNIPGTPDKTMP